MMFDIVKEGRRFGYTIYRNPSDFPGKLVVRGWDIEDGKTAMAPDAIAVDDTEVALQTLRASLDEQGLVCIGRHVMDDPVILETWI